MKEKDSLQESSNMTACHYLLALILLSRPFSSLSSCCVKLSSLKEARESQKVAEEKLEKTTASLTKIEQEIAKMSLELRPEEKIKYAPASSSSSSSSSSVKSALSKLEKTLAELTAKKNGLSFDPLKVTKYNELEQQMNLLLKGKTESRKNKEKLVDMLEVSKRRGQS